MEPDIAAVAAAVLGGSETTQLHSVVPTQTSGIIQTMTQPHSESMPGASLNVRKRRISGTSALTTEDSEQELRLLAQEYIDKPIDVIAAKVRAEDNANSPHWTLERNRQVFGTVWLIKTCQIAPHHAIPRNRIYARYVEICAHFKIKPMNPAAFGKLVKLMFPDIKTRRLGVRGQSKYHYCGINFVGENLVPEIKIHANDDGSPSGHERMQTPDINDEAFEADLELVTSGRDSSQTPAQQSLHGDSGNQGTGTSSIEKNDATNLEKTFSGEYFDESLSTLDTFTIPSLRFNNDNLIPSSLDIDSFSLPSIEPFVPAGTDSDSVAILFALCRSHYSSLLESIRFMHLKQFLNTLSSFHGTLTVPVQRLLNIPSILVWIQRCDWVTYKEMIRLLAPLALQVVPVNVMTALRSLSMTLPHNIATAFRSLPADFVHAKLKPAYTFANLIGRLLRVNDTANAAAKILANPGERRSMLRDWVNFVDAKSLILREAPCSGQVGLKILNEDVINLLVVTDEVDLTGIVRREDFQGKTVELGNGTFDAGRNDSSPLVNRRRTGREAAQRDQNATSPPENEKIASHEKEVEENMIEQWAQYLQNLPLQFPEASARVFLLYMNSVLTAALREITLNGGEAFGAWWMVRCWIDEWMAWVAERGGFMSDNFVPSTNPARDSTTANISAVGEPTDKLDNNDLVGDIDDLDVDVDVDDPIVMD
ncbi:RFX DNA-binding domain-containing protein [Lipomyces japonicus]|uniref:RFX DNA-binding domain-containing protein n=1 Tax=Lipomyces japonicus TaxID=56871 RepID=UPI0034CFDD05